MYVGACRAVSDVLAAMEWVQPDVTLTVTHAKPLDSNLNVEIAIPSLIQYQKKSRVKMVLKHSWAPPSSTRYTKLQLNY